MGKRLQELPKKGALKVFKALVMENKCVILLGLVVIGLIWKISQMDKKQAAINMAHDRKIQGLLDLGIAQIGTYFKKITESLDLRIKSLGSASKTQEETIQQLNVQFALYNKQIKEANGLSHECKKILNTLSEIIEAIRKDMRIINKDVRIIKKRQLLMGSLFIFLQKTINASAFRVGTNVTRVR